MPVQKWIRAAARRLMPIVIACGLLTGVAVVTATPALANDPFGTLELSGSSWFGGHGVNVYSNGPYRYVSNTYDYVTINNQSVNVGMEWQCVELAQRFYTAMGWHTGIFSGVPDGAYEIYTNANQNGFTTQPYSNVTSIVPGDMIVNGTSDTYSPGAGHVAIVNYISGSTIYAIQQNAPYATTYTLTNGTLSGGSGTDILGVVHSPNNTNTGSGGGFGSGYRAAFQANTENLYTFDSTAGAAATGQGMASGTNPAITSVAAGHEEAFQANGTNHLYLYGDVSTGDTQQGMMPGTSPAIAAQPNSNNFEVAFQVNTGALYTYQHTSSGDIVTPTTWGLMSGTSPSIAVLSTGTYELAFQAAGTGDLYVWGPSNDGIIDTGQGMMAGTSPSIAASPSGGYVVAFQANNGYLYYFNSNHVTSPTNQGMARGTSPAITAPPSGGYETVFQAAGSNYMYTYGNYSTGNTQQGMMPGTSPAITGLSGGFEAAFQANNGYLYVYSSASGSALDTQQGMASGTSPCIG